MPISTSLQQKSQMPLAHGARDNDELSLALSRKRELETVDAFQASNFAVTLSSDGVLLPSSHLISSGTWMKIVVPEIQPATQLITRSRCHPVKCVEFLSLSGGFFG